MTFIVALQDCKVQPLFVPASVSVRTTAPRLQSLLPVYCSRAGASGMPTHFKMQIYRYWSWLYTCTLQTSAFILANSWCVAHWTLHDCRSPVCHHVHLCLQGNHWGPGQTQLCVRLVFLYIKLNHIFGFPPEAPPCGRRDEQSQGDGTAWSRVEGDRVARTQSWRRRQDFKQWILSRRPRHFLVQVSWLLLVMDTIIVPEAHDWKR